MLHDLAIRQLVIILSRGIEGRNPKNWPNMPEKPLKQIHIYFPHIVKLSVCACLNSRVLIIEISKKNPSL